MNIQCDGLDIKASLNWDDWVALTEGREIGTRYDAENKLLIQMSNNQKHCAQFDRRSMDIFAYVPEHILRDVGHSYSIFNLGLGNLDIIPDSDLCEDMSLKICYPGSLKTLDIFRFLESERQ